MQKQNKSGLFFPYKTQAKVRINNKHKTNSIIYPKAFKKIHKKPFKMKNCLKNYEFDIPMDIKSNSKMFSLKIFGCKEAINTLLKKGNGDTCLNNTNCLSFHYSAL